MSNERTIEEMKMAAELTAHEDFMGLCAGGFPLVAFEKQCQFCGATWEDKCKRCDRDANGPARPSGPPRPSAPPDHTPIG